ncbi:MAG: hypothetical protein VX428_09110 [Verrucomicrobiota bacterium]|nr:hypothetical protein [Verrucomicrobiota bacterium]
MNSLIKILIMCRKRITFIICIFSLSLILNDTLAESPNYKINLSGSGKPDNRKIEVTSLVDSVIFNVFDKFGIGAASIKIIEGDWPKKVLIRFHLSGLEGFTLSSQGMNYKKNTFKVRMSDIKGNTIKGKYLVRNEGGDSKKIPGYFEIEIPKKITTDSSMINLKWIDYYR